MLKNLLKYEFRATARTYGGIYRPCWPWQVSSASRYGGIAPLPRAMSLKLA